MSDQDTPLDIQVEFERVKLKEAEELEGALVDLGMNKESANKLVSLTDVEAFLALNSHLFEEDE